MADNNKELNVQSVYNTTKDIYGKEIKSIPAPGKEIGVDTQKTLFHNIIESGESSVVDLNQLNSFSSISNSRNQVYDLIDSMCEDSIISAVLETYAEDATEYNDQGKIVWCESSDANISKYITFLLDSMNIDKQVYRWVHSLCKYGDLYLRLYRQSDYDDGLFEPNKKAKKPLNEEVKIKAYADNDSYVNYIEMWANPAEVFELTRFGKTYAYIQADVNNINTTGMQQDFTASLYQYSFNKGDVNIHSATDFVHAALEDNTSRTPETVTILKGSKDGKTDLNYTVKRGQSLLYNVYKTWRELSLLENSLILNRVTKSSIVRIISVEVGDMPKESVGPHLMGIKNMIEQKAAISTGKSLSEYTNPGPVENNIYVPTHEGVGAITTSEIGGNPDVKSIVDLEYYKDKMFGALRVPKQYFGDTDDSAGFNGGTSLSIISSRYAKMIKRIQNTICQCITDAINLLLVDRGLVNYINNFYIKMLPPTTQEEIDRRDNIAAKIQLATDTMNMLSDVNNPVIKFKIMKSLLSGILSNTEVTQLLQEYIDELEEEGKNTDKSSKEETPVDSEELPSLNNLPEEEPEELDLASDVLNPTETEESGEKAGSEQILPTPEELGIDMTVNN